MNTDENDILMMRRALRLATLGRGFASPNPMVGAVITDVSGLITGEGWHRCWGGPHAEVNAVASARARGADLRECTIYVTLEPCAHFGKTPPCARLLAECGFRRVVIGSVDPFPKVAGRGIEILRAAGIDVTCGVLEDECRSLNRRFFFAHTHRRPWVMLKWAQSLDGFMAGPGNEPVAFSTPVSQMWMHRERAACDAILAGTGTLIADDPSLTVRLWPHRRSVPVVLMGARTPRYCKVLCNPLTIKVDAGLGLAAALEELYVSHGITSLMVEGGAHMLASFMREDLWQEMRIEVSPILLHEGLKAPEVPMAELHASPCGGNMIYTRSNVNGR